MKRLKTKILKIKWVLLTVVCGYLFLSFERGEILFRLACKKGRFKRRREQQRDCGHAYYITDPDHAWWFDWEHSLCGGWNLKVKALIEELKEKRSQLSFGAFLRTLLEVTFLIILWKLDHWESLNISKKDDCKKVSIILSWGDYSDITFRDEYSTDIYGNKFNIFTSPWYQLF